MKNNIVRTAALALSGALTAGAAYAADANSADASHPADKPCLESARIYGWEAPNERTLIVTDYSKKQYKVSLSGVCSGLDNTKIAIAFVTLSKISCVGPGDAVRYRDQVFGPQRCLVSGVEAYTPPPKPK
jgi:hypothetical protein